MQGLTSPALTTKATSCGAVPTSASTPSSHCSTSGDQGPVQTEPFALTSRSLTFLFLTGPLRSRVKDHAARQVLRTILLPVRMFSVRAISCRLPPLCARTAKPQVHPRSGVAGTPSRSITKELPHARVQAPVPERSLGGFAPGVAQPTCACRDCPHQRGCCCDHRLSRFHNLSPEPIQPNPMTRRCSARMIDDAATRASLIGRCVACLRPCFSAPDRLVHSCSR